MKSKNRHHHDDINVNINVTDLLARGEDVNLIALLIRSFLERKIESSE